MVSGIAIDTGGRLLMMHRTTADISDSAGERVVIAALRKRWPWIGRLFADSAYDRRQMPDKVAMPNSLIRRNGRSERPYQVRGSLASLWAWVGMS